MIGRTFSALFIGLVSLASLEADQTLLNGIAAIVNEQVITAERVDLYADVALTATARQYIGKPRSAWEQKKLEIRKEALERLIDRQLILEEFKQKGFNLPDNIIDDFVKADIRERYRDRLTLTKELQSRNQTFDDYRKQLRDDIIIANMRSKNVNAQIIISPKRIQAYYETNQAQFTIPTQVKLRMILLDKTKRGDGEALAVANTIVEKVRAGAKFADLANSFSEDAARNKGGDRGWVEDNDSFLRKELRDVAFKLKPGEVSEPVVIQNTVFVLMVEERKEAGLRPLNECRNEIENALRTQEFDRLVANWTKRLRAKAYVRYF